MKNPESTMGRIRAVLEQAAPDSLDSETIVERVIAATSILDAAPAASTIRNALHNLRSLNQIHSRRDSPRAALRWFNGPDPKPKEQKPEPPRREPVFDPIAAARRPGELIPDFLRDSPAFTRRPASC